ncbi:2-phospho-L-lactate transferase [Paraburkholderia antibiotica]|uniref:2-phospho-L-lactate transferase n=1 Tax=Paraburkholderia antibiotica TaxID=2728839 RepID=A0A7X9X6G4_9BURK|nr:2-phospho-L-lactate transferase [Paraburkholderia antibiotica]NML32356.1 2-phospho-L-lactate transferase [Paraburkholderia antibiotica]
MRERIKDTRVVLLAGGVGGARMAVGLNAVLEPGSLGIVANIGDDEDFYGLRICPDLDTLLYTLSGKVDPRQGWGVRDDATRALDVLGELGAPVWMKLGDADMGLHIWRSWRLSLGERLSDVMAAAAARFGVEAELLPVCDSPVPTEIVCDEGTLRFQQWFVGRRAAPAVREVRYREARNRVVTPDALRAIERADLVVIAPSNPLLSIEPMLALGGLREALRASTAPCVAVSPLIGGKAVKGPLDRMLDDMGLPGGNAGVAQRYAGLLDGLVIHADDAVDCAALRERGLAVLCAGTRIASREASAELAGALLAWARDDLRGGRPADRAVRPECAA